MAPSDVQPAPDGDVLRRVLRAVAAGAVLVVVLHLLFGDGLWRSVLAGAAVVARIVVFDTLTDRRAHRRQRDRPVR
ncbi:hypothetical protein [Kineococcus sp. SYSU DK004]|uniref:hypothetical protein n=1 Tax=Kineococcus sp. SYSU DK004 TaxID=3383125 RepID=UPI003D7C8B5F